MKDFDVKKVLIVTVRLTVAGSLIMLLGIPVVHVVRPQLAGGVSCAVFALDGTQTVLYGEEKCGL